MTLAELAQIGSILGAIYASVGFINRLFRRRSYVSVRENIQAVILVVLGLYSAYQYATYERPVEKITEYITNKEFRNEEIVLDGRSYRKCKFYNVTFTHKGGAAIFSENEVYGPVVLQPGTAPLHNFYLILKGMGQLKSTIPFPVEDLEHIEEPRYRDK